MPLTIPDEVRAKAEVYVGDAAGKEKTRFLLEETGLPSGLLPLRDIIECGYVEETGFVWLKQRRKVSHYFPKAGRHVTYGAEVSAVAEKGRLKKITGVKAKEMLIWVTLHEIAVDDPPTGKLTCKAIGGISRSFPVEAFEADPNEQPVPAPADADVDSQEDDSPPAEDADEEVAEEAAAGEDKKPAEGEPAAAEAAAEKDKDAVDEVDGKLKDLTPAEAVAAKN